MNKYNKVIILCLSKILNIYLCISLPLDKKIQLKPSVETMLFSLWQAEWQVGMLCRYLLVLWNSQKDWKISTGFTLKSPSSVPPDKS